MKNIRKWLPVCFMLILCLFTAVSLLDTQEKNYETAFDQKQIETHIANLTANGPRSIADKEENQAALDYITSTLESLGVTNEDTTDAPAYLVQDFVAEDEDYQNWYLKNIIVHIPANAAEPTNEALMFMGHTDSVPMGDGASDDGIACSVMLEAIDYYLEQMANGYILSNDLVFCFVNGEEYGLYGSNAFMKEFNGFDNVVERIKFGTNLESRGTSGTLIMFETAKNNYNTIKMFSEINENVFTCSIATMIYDMMPNGTDFSNFKEAYQGLNFANISGGEDYHTQNDSLERTLGSAHLSQQAQIVNKIIDKLANYNLSDLYDAEESAIFFSYLNIKTVVYNHLMAVILAVIAIVLLAANVLLRAFYRKEKGLVKTAAGVGSIVIGLAFTAALTYICYYVFQYIAVLAGTIDREMVGTITYSNTAIVVGIGLVALAVTTMVSHFCCKMFKIEGRDMTRAFAYVHAVLGIVLSFVLADTSYLFIFSGILLMVNEVWITLAGKRDEKQKADAEQDADAEQNANAAQDVNAVQKTGAAQYHAELLVTAVCMPIVMPVLSLATSALGLTMAYVFGLIFALAIFSVGIYLAPYLKVKKSLLVFAAGCAIFLGVSLAESNAQMNLQGKQNIAKLPYDDALVYAVEMSVGELTEAAAEETAVNDVTEAAAGETEVNDVTEAAADETANTVSGEYRIYDLNAYQALKEYAPTEMIWTEESCYVGEGEKIEVALSVLSAIDRNVLSIKKADEAAQVYLTFKNIEAESFTIADGTTTQEYIFADNLNEDGAYKITIHDNCTVTVNDGSADVEYREVVRDYAPCIPEGYDETQKLHFNLWMESEFVLGE